MGLGRHCGGAAMNDRVLYRVEEAAEMLAISRTKAYELIAAGKLPSVRLGGSRRISKADMDALIAQSKAS